MKSRGFQIDKFLALVRDGDRPHRVAAFGDAFQAGRLERDLARLQDRGTHVHRDAAVIFQARGDDAAHRFDADAALVGQALVADEPDERARAVAALLDFAAVVVIDAVAEVAAFRDRALDDQDLVGTDAEAAVGQAAPLLRAEIDVLVDRVDHDEIVAGAVHLGELEFHGICH